MPVRIEGRFKTWVNRLASFDIRQAVEESVTNMGNDLEQDAKELVDNLGITYRGDYRDAITANVEGVRAGVQTRYEVQLGVDDEIAPHVEWINRGAGPFKTPFPHRNVIEWASIQLGKDLREARTIAMGVALYGQQVSADSRLRSLPPSGQQGFSLALTLEAEGIIDRHIDRFGDELERHIRFEFENF